MKYALVQPMMPPPGYISVSNTCETLSGIAHTYNNNVAALVVGGHCFDDLEFRCFMYATISTDKLLIVADAIG